MGKTSAKLPWALLLLAGIVISVAVQTRPNDDLELTSHRDDETSAQPPVNDCNHHFHREAMKPLMLAALDGRTEEVRRLLRRGTKVDERLDVDINITPLMFAAFCGRIETIKVLLEAGANPNAEQGIAHAGYYTPLTMALNPNNKNRLEVIDTLVAGGALLNPPPTFDESPLGTAVSKNDPELVRALLKRGSDVNWQDTFGTSPLVTAVTIADKNVEMVKLLLDAGADPNKPTIWDSEECVSILSLLEDHLALQREKVTEDIRDLIIQARGKRLRKKSNNEPCKPWTSTDG